MKQVTKWFKFKRRYSLLLKLFRAHQFILIITNQGTDGVYRDCKVHTFTPYTTRFDAVVLHHAARVLADPTIEEE